MRYICASLALCAVLLSVLFVPAASAQKRIKPTSPKVDTVTAPIDEVKQQETTPDLLAPESSQTDIVGPPGSGQFGSQVTVLPNGNIVVTDPFFDITSPSTIADVGAVYLYNGETLALISQLTGSSASDQVGSGGVTVLSNGNYVVKSSFWKNGTASFAGAATWGSATAGVSGVVSASNSLVGTTSGDSISNVTALTNGNYIVHSINWDNGSAQNAGSATFCNGTTGTVGAVTASNSLVGTTAFANVGGQIFPLPNGNYLVYNNVWPSNNVERYGAVTFGNGTTGIAGAVSSANSLVGSKTSDVVGSSGITILSNGNYVVNSSNWDNGAAADAGAVTWGSGTTGVSGVVSSSNSIVGSTANNNVGSNGVTALTNGNYVIRSSQWDNGATLNVGAVTWGNGATGSVGVVSASNSLIGSTATDSVGNFPMVALPNGNYVVASVLWDNAAAANAGAVTWGNGLGGTVGTVSSSNSLVGSVANSQVGNGGVVALTNGNYVVSSGNWANGAVTGAGAVTWGNGTSGTSGVVSASNSLVGTTSGDGVGSVLALTNGNYVVTSVAWDNGSAANAGAVTWGNGAGGTVGAITASNSLVGTVANDNVGSPRVIALTNGNYVVGSSLWGGGPGGPGAATWGNGSTGTVGTISSSNSLIGSPGDRVGFGNVWPLANGNYIVASPFWQGSRGAVTWGNGTTGTTGVVSSGNSLIGTSTSDSVGNAGIFALPDGDYLVRSSSWDNGTAGDAGAVTFGDGSSGTTGNVSASNSLVGSTSGDNVGNGTFVTLPNGNYIVITPSWNNGASIDAGAVSFGGGNGGISGIIDASNSVRGTVANPTVSPLLPNGSPLSNERLVVGRQASNIVTILNPTYRAVADGNWTAGATWNYGSFSKPHDVVIPAGRSIQLDASIPGPDGSVTIDSEGSLEVTGGDRVSGSPITNNGFLRFASGKLDMGANLLSVGCGGDTQIEFGQYLIGSVNKQFCLTGSYLYPLGTADGYSPVNVNVTSLNTNPSSLTVSSTASVHPKLHAPNSLDRYWSITESGDLTADLIFNYVDGDVVGNESAYRLYRIEGAGLPESMSTAVHNESGNFMSIVGVSQFSDWAIGSLAPSAANVSVSGRVTDAFGRSVSGALVRFTGFDGSVRVAVTNTMGYYRIDGLLAGSSYAAMVETRRYSFDARVVSLQDDLTALDFRAR